MKKIILLIILISVCIINNDIKKELLVFNNNDIYYYIKYDKYEEFINKINYLYTLKYPKHICSNILNNNDYEFIFEKDKLLVYLNGYKLSVSYNQINEYLNNYMDSNNDFIDSGYNYDINKKSVIFTYDDSPNKNKTNILLDILKDNYSTATFFMLGENMNMNKELVKMVYYSNNEIGSHTYNHINLNNTDYNKFIKDYNKFNDLYYDITLDNVKYFRPPYGNIKYLDYIDKPIILWSLDTNDWKNKDVNYLVNYILENIEDGDIVLFHDMYDETIEATSIILPKLYDLGYEVMSISNYIKLHNIKLDNKVYYNFK